MVLTIYFDGKEAVIYGPSQGLIDQVMSTQSVQSHISITSGHDTNQGHNCKKILVFPARRVGDIINLLIQRTSISAVQLAEATSQANAR